MCTLWKDCMASRNADYSGGLETQAHWLACVRCVECVVRGVRSVLCEVSGVCCVRCTECVVRGVRSVL